MGAGYASRLVLRLTQTGRRCASAAMGLFLIGSLAVALNANSAAAYTANKVWFSFLATGRYRVSVNYTVPELKELREAYVEFQQKKDAEKFYFDLLRGADFYPTDPKLRQFVKQSLKPDPW